MNHQLVHACFLYPRHHPCGHGLSKGRQGHPLDSEYEPVLGTQFLRPKHAGQWIIILLSSVTFLKLS